jgi:hypothetical protein
MFYILYLYWQEEMHPNRQKRLEKEKDEFLQNNPNYTCTFSSDWSWSFKEEAEPNNIITIKGDNIELCISVANRHPFILPLITILSNKPSANSNQVKPSANSNQVSFPTKYRREEGTTWFEVSDTGQITSSYLRFWSPMITFDKILRHVNEEIIIANNI